ncbi:MAG: hypothetical protein AAB903_02535, partial [Patescibacteria group bacterium]
TTRIWTLRADILLGANFSSIRARLLSGTKNIQGTTSRIYSSTGGVTGNSLTLHGGTSGTLITASQNTAIGTQTVAAGQTGAKIGSYVLTPSSGEGVNLTSIQVTMSGSGNLFSNLRLMVGSTQFGVTQPISSPNGIYNFAGALNVPADGTKVVDIYTDVLSSISPILYPAVTSITNCVGSGAVTFTPAGGCSATGQAVMGAGQATIQVALDSGSPPASQLVMGSTNNTLGIFRFTETSNAEDVKVTQLYILDRVSSTAVVKPAFSNLTLYSGTTLLAQAGTPTFDGNAYGYMFNFSTPLFVPRLGSVSLALKGDVASYSSSGATDNSRHVFGIAVSSNPQTDTPGEVVVALGHTSNATSAVVLSSPVGNTMTVLRTKLTVSGAGVGTTSGRAKSSVDDLGNITFTADSAGALLLNNITVTFAGSAPSGTAFYGSSQVRLYDPESGISYSGIAHYGTSITYDLNNYAVSAGSSKTFRVRINSNLAAGGGTTAMAQAGVSQSLTALINAGADVTYTDALFGGTPGITLPTTGFGAPPISINSVTYASGT